MLTAQRQSLFGPIGKSAPPLSLPAWVRNLFTGSTSRPAQIVPRSDGAITLGVAETGGLLLATGTVRGATALPPLMLQRRTTEAYAAIHQLLTAQRTWHPVRIWNWIPDIHAPMDDAVDRYMVFNAGRFAAYHSCYESGRTFETAIATATGVGHDGDDLVIQVLAGAHSGTSVENPRQIRSYRYSEKFGPMPPCFARATLTPDSTPAVPDLLIGGTASVRGEASVHTGDVGAQCHETLKNLAHLIAQAGCVRRHAKQSVQDVDLRAELRRLDSLRVFCVKTAQMKAIFEIVWPFVDHLERSRFEFVRADICRRELLVEIEGTAGIAP